jgi:hypothetical protein
MDSFLSRVLGKDAQAGGAGAGAGGGGREYWVDDAKCRTCYECEAAFNLLTRRHHCRICGRVFCGACTAHSVPPPRDAPDQSWQRVCNYCEPH